MAPRESTTLAFIAVGGAVGASARWEVGKAFPVVAGHFPWSTLAVNVGGSLALGFLLVLLLERVRPHSHVRALLGIGFLGAFTTYSTFAVESVRLMEHGHAGTGVAYVVVSVVLGLLAAVVGGWSARRVPVGSLGPAEPGRSG